MQNNVTIASTLRTNLTRGTAAAMLLAAAFTGNAAQAAQVSTAVPAVNATSNATAQEQVRQLYLTLLGREPDAGGLQFYVQAMSRGVPLSAIEAEIKRSNEYLQRQGNVAPATPKIPATAINYYVAPNGSDSAAGSKAAPFKTLARAAQVATKAGTTVWVAPGTYAGGIKTVASGTAAARIYWVSTTKWGAKIVPPANSTNKTAWDNRGNYVSIIGFDVDGSKIGSGTKWVLGIYTGGSYNVIDGNHVHHMATTIPCNSAGGSAIGVDSYYKGVKGDVINNVVNDIGPAGCTYVQGIYHSTSGTIKNNVVYRVGSAAIHLWHDATDIQIVNNTVSASVFGIIVGGGDFYFTKAGANNVHVHNNIVYDNTYGISEQGTTGKGNTYKNNLVTKNTKYAFQLRNGLTHIGTITSEPLMAGYSRTAALPNFKLSTSSPAIGRGIATYAPASDIDGKARGAAIDLGAYQH